MKDEKIMEKVWSESFKEKTIGEEEFKKYILKAIKLTREEERNQLIKIIDYLIWEGTLLSVEKEILQRLRGVISKEGEENEKEK